jgi:hypothetical protein
MKANLSNVASSCVNTVESLEMKSPDAGCNRLDADIKQADLA